MKQKFLLVLVALFCVIFSVNAAVLGDKYVKVMDAFLVKLETYKDNSNYIQLLDSFTLQLNSLKSKYSSNSNV
ncbi:MAG: hypothetical protein LBQ24_04720 [Candidatus Peribacteria bacterium]|jgi:hypothetical protein|nr:hypothetical protein [Candidatus Peribacteria bacterium]